MLVFNYLRVTVTNLGCHTSHWCQRCDLNGRIYAKGLWK